MSSAAATDHMRPPPPLQVNSGHALPGTFGLPPVTAVISTAVH